MEHEIGGFSEANQDNSVQSGTTFSDYKERVERENQAFDKMITQQRQLIEYLSRQLVQLNLRVDKCDSRLREIQTSVDQASSDFKSSKRAFTIALLRLQEELDLFDELYA